MFNNDEIEYRDDHEDDNYEENMEAENIKLKAENLTNKNHN